MKRVAVTAALAIAGLAAQAGVYEDRERDWRNGAVVYQVLVDRFAPPADLEAKRALYPAPKRLHAWTQTPRRGPYLPDQQLHAHELDFWGGDLASTAARLDHVQRLGADALYLNPIHLAWTNHKYDALDFQAVSPEYGTRDDFRRLAADAAWGASAAAVVVQALGLATAIAIAGLTLPRAGSGVRLAAAALLAGAVLVALTSSRVIEPIGRRIPRLAGLRPLPLGALLGAGAFTVVGWIGYGASLWALARGLGLPGPLPLALATGGFALAYTAGLLALFAPGGIVIREGVLVAVLAPHLGAGPALALSLGSRVVLTGAELLAATPFVYSWLRSPPRATG